MVTARWRGWRLTRNHLRWGSRAARKIAGWRVGRATRVVASWQVGRTRPSEQQLPVADVDPLAEFVADLFEVGYGAEAEFLKERHARVVGKGDAAHSAVKIAAAQLDQDRIEER